MLFQDGGTKDNIKINLNEILREGFDSIHLA
jgi:hypothetical protein